MATQFGPGEDELLPAQERAASTTASDKEGFVEATPSRVLRDGVGMSLFKLSHHPLFQFEFKTTAYEDPEYHAILLPILGQGRPHGQSKGARSGHGCRRAPSDDSECRPGF